MKRDLEKHAMTVLKTKAKALNLTQSKLALEMGVSLPTIKRWWAGHGVSLTVLNGLCGVLGLSLSQLFLEVEGGSQVYTYSLEQEKMLAANPRVLALFDLLVSGKRPEHIRAKYSLEERDLVAMLLKIERVNLIQLHAKNRVKLVNRGEPQWIVGGPLSAKYRERMIQALLGRHNKSEVSFFIHDYLPDDVVLLRGKVKELENLMNACNVRGISRGESAKSYGSYMCLKEFEWDLRGCLLEN